MKWLLVLFCVPAFAAKPIIVIGSKSFTESYLLAEIAAQTIEAEGEAAVERRFGLGQTGIAFEALRDGRIDLYPEYTGTVWEAILKRPSGGGLVALRTQLAPLGITAGVALGFDNTYALALRAEKARELGVAKISDLLKSRELRAGFSHEFLERPDCYPRLRERYGLDLSHVQGIAHSLAYEALEAGSIDVTDIYSTDAKVAKFGLTVLDDDRHAFPEYEAIFLAGKDFEKRFPRSWAAVRRLGGKFDEAKMRHLNERAEIDHASFAQVAAEARGKRAGEKLGRFESLGPLAQQHLALVFVSLLFSIVIGIPLAIAGSRSPALGQVILLVSGIIQTIPSLALLCFLIPPFGIGTPPALVALFLYGLLPIVRGGYLGLTSIDPKLKEVAKALGLTKRQRLAKVELPLAFPAIMSGVKTSAVINVGTATLAALIGAGGLGVPIVTGLALNDIPTILDGAIPAAAMALVVHGLFELLDRYAMPRGLRSHR